MISPNDSNASSNSDLPPRRLESSLDAAVAVTQRASIPPPPSSALSLLLRTLISNVDESALIHSSCLLYQNQLVAAERRDDSEAELGDAIDSIVSA